MTVRVPYRTSGKTITKLVSDKSGWIIKHTGNMKNDALKNPARRYINGEIHLFRGSECVLRIDKTERPYCRFSSNQIGLGTASPENNTIVKRLLYAGYRREALKFFTDLLFQILSEKSSYGFRVSKLRVRTMKSRWGSCTSKGVIALNTELIRLPDRFTRYVILHELSHLRHHNHGTGFYKLLTELFPEWRSVRKELKEYILGR